MAVWVGSLRLKQRSLVTPITQTIKKIIIIINSSRMVVVGKKEVNHHHFYI